MLCAGEVGEGDRRRDGPRLEHVADARRDRDATHRRERRLQDPERVQLSDHRQTRRRAHHHRARTHPPLTLLRSCVPAFLRSLFAIRQVSILE